MWSYPLAVVRGVRFVAVAVCRGLQPLPPPTRCWCARRWSRCCDRRLAIDPQRQSWWRHRHWRHAPPHAPLPPPPGVVMQLPLVQVRPLLQAVPPQHASPLPPHAPPPPPPPMGVAHVPEVHARPGLHAVPQHIWPLPPHAAGAGLHAPASSQTSPLLHELPAQHGWSRSPHAVGVWQVSEMHARVPVQVAPAQHAWPAPPHASHMPLLQVKPAEQVSPRQHAWPMAPQPGDAAMQVPPLHVVPSQQSALVSQRSPMAWQQRPVMHCIPSQHSPGAVHVAAGSEQHAPSRQSRPRSHAVPPQHRWLAWPQRPGSGGDPGLGASRSFFPKSSTKVKSSVGVVASISATWPPAQADAPRANIKSAAERSKRVRIRGGSPGRRLPHSPRPGPVVGRP